jgi:hypothetical protein
MTQVAEQNDRRLVARDMGPRRHDQGADDHLFDVTEYFPGSWLDMRGVERKPPGSGIPHDLSLRRRPASDGPARALREWRLGPRFNTTRSRSSHNNPARRFFQVNGSDIARRGPVATPRGVADCLFCGIADDVPPSTAAKRSMALNPE